MNNYIGTYEYIQSDTFRPTQERRTHIGKETAGTITASQKNDGIIVGRCNEMNNLRIRKLTPKECFRLMGVKDDDFEKIKKHQSDSSLYHLAGDSIVTTVLMAIFGEMLGIDWQEKIDELLKEGVKNETETDDI